jgi:hypothetical protein
MLLVNEFMKQTLLAKLLPTPKQALREYLDECYRRGIIQ